MGTAALCHPPQSVLALALAPPPHCCCCCPFRCRHCHCCCCCCCWSSTGCCDGPSAAASGDLASSEGSKGLLRGLGNPSSPMKAASRPALWGEAQVGRLWGQGQPLPRPRSPSALGHPEEMPRPETECPPSLHLPPPPLLLAPSPLAPRPLPSSCPPARSCLPALHLPPLLLPAGPIDQAAIWFQTRKERMAHPHHDLPLAQTLGAGPMGQFRSYFCPVTYKSQTP